MSFNNNSYIVSNEQLFLIDILNGMYNDNLRQINNFTTNINNLNETNTHIRNILIQILNNNDRRNNNDGRSNNDRRNNNDGRSNAFRENNINQNNNSDIGRAVLNNIPYIIDSVREYRIPYNINNISETSNSNFSRLLQNFFQPIEVFPTQSQIETATRQARYCDIIIPINRSCPISLDNFEDNEMVTVIRQCGHIFRSEDLNTWFRSHCNCPVCRYDIREYNLNVSSEFFGSTETSNQNNISNQINSQETNVERSQPNELNIESSILNLLLGNNFNSESNRNTTLFTDMSGNFLNNVSDSVSLLNLLSSFNTRNQR